MNRKTGQIKILKRRLKILETSTEQSTTIYTVSQIAHGTFSRLDCMPGQIFNKFEKFEILQSIFFCHKLSKSKWLNDICIWIHSHSEFLDDHLM